MNQELTADQIVGLILWTKEPVTLHKYAAETAPVLETVAAGQSIGQVTSWVSANPLLGRKNLWWEFQYGDGTYFYVEHKKGRFDWDKLKAQLPAQVDPGFKIPDTAILAAVLFAGFQAFTATRQNERMLYGAGAAVAAAYLIVKKLKTVDFNPFN